jgi:hypothetical protein
MSAMGAKATMGRGKDFQSNIWPMLAVNTIFSRVWVRRLSHFILGAVLSHFLIVFLSNFIYRVSFLKTVVNILIAPALLTSSFITVNWERWGWAIIVNLLAVAVFWGLVAVAIGWGWDEWKKRK